MDTQDLTKADSEPAAREAERQEAGTESSGSADGRVVRADPIPGAVELAHLLTARIEEVCRELDEKREQIETLKRSLAERDGQIQVVQRELNESRDLVARLAEASQQDATAETDAAAAAEGSETDAPADPVDIEDDAPRAGLLIDAAPVAATEDGKTDAPADSAAEIEAADAVSAAEDGETDAPADSADIEEDDAPQPGLPIDAELVAAAVTRQAAEHTEDQAELDDHLSQLAHWAARVDTLEGGLTRSVAAAASELEECGRAFGSLPPELQETLRGRHEGLQLIGKMIHRLPDRLPQVGEPPERSLPFLSQEEWTALLAGGISRESADKRIRDKLEEMSSKRYKALSQARRAVETSRQNVLQFLKAQVLPVLDGIEDGEMHSKELIVRLKTTESESAESLEIWYRVYATLHAELLGLLSQVKVRPLEVRRGMPIDYDCQEPFGVEADPDLNTEDVKAVTRTGYEFTMDESEESLVLRPAQVIVVKNAKEPNRA